MLQNCKLNLIGYLILSIGYLSNVNKGIKEAEKLMEKICYQFVGTWVAIHVTGE